MLPAFAAAEALGITYMESVKKMPCSLIRDPSLKSMSTGSNRQATACCTGSMLNTAEGGCGSTLPDTTSFTKRNANNKKDGGLYAARKFTLERYMTQYNCPSQCMLQSQNKDFLAAAVTKTSTGTCINFISPSGCVTQQGAGYIDCRPCAGIFNNVAPESFASEFKIGKPSAESELEKMIQRVQSAAEAEPLGNVLDAGGDPLVVDDTARCHTPSSFSCPGPDSDYEQQVEAGKCEEVESTKIDNMCDDGPCDNDENSLACRMAKAKCLVDPDSGVKCMPGSENDPCMGCIRAVSSGEKVVATFVSFLLFALLL